MGKQLDQIDAQIQKLQKNKKLSPEELKQVAELKKRKKAICDKVVQASLKLSHDALTLPLPKFAPLAAPVLRGVPPKQDVLELNGWLSKAVTGGGIPLGDSVTLRPMQPEIDLKTGKIRRFEVKIIVNFW